MFSKKKPTEKDKQILTEILNYQNMFKLKVIDIKPLNDIRILDTELNGFLVKCEDQTDNMLLTSFNCLIPKIKEWAYNNSYSLISWKEKQNQYVVDIRKKWNRNY
jgi:hypothetical protein